MTSAGSDTPSDDDKARPSLDERKFALERAKLEMDSKRLALEELKVELEDRKLEVEQEKLRLERHKRILDRHRAKLEFYKVREDARRPSAEAITKFGDATIRSLLILNGGAALGLLTFAANARVLGSTISASSLQMAVASFGAGAALATATAFLAYVSQAFYHRQKVPYWYSPGNIIRAVSILVGTVSLGAFGFGTWTASTIVEGSRTPAALQINAPPTAR